MTLLLLPLLSSLTLAAAVSAEDAPPPESRRQQTCGLYLAPSSTRDPAASRADGGGGDHRRVRLGLYAGRDYRPSDVIGYPEIAVHVYDSDGHAGRTVLTDEEMGIPSPDDDDDEDDVEERRARVKPENVNYFRFMSEQMWTADSTGAKYETSEGVGGPGQIFTAIPGAGMLGNFHPGIANADWDHGSALGRTLMSDSESTPGVDHPGRGAVSEYYNVTLTATRRIPAGMEVFVDFGLEWSRENTEEGQATEEDYDRADRTIAKVLEFMDKYSDSLTPELSEKIYDFLLKDVVPIGSETSDRGKVARSLLPDDHTQLRAVRDAGGSLRHRNPDVFRDLVWLEENGQCTDNIHPGPSTVPHAGRGAFATRRIGRGELVSPMPLVHIPHRREMDMYDLEAAETEGGDGHGHEVLVRRGGDDAMPAKRQLLLNYCFGHPESNVLLYPFGTASNFINHRPGDGANARIVWSSPDGPGLKIHRPEWLEVEPRRLADPEYDRVGLAFDVVATRDIEPGEEIFLDYGPEWQTAWDEHVAEFVRRHPKSGGGGGYPLTALEMNALYRTRTPGVGYAKPFETEEERVKSPYHERIATACHASYEDIPDGEGGDRYLDGLRVFRWAEDREVWRGSSLRLCDVLTRVEIEEEGTGEITYNYTAGISLESHVDGSSESRIVRDVPHGAVRFVDRPYMGDQHRADAFRHHIGIPNDMFPEAWRDRREEEGGVN